MTFDDLPGGLGPRELYEAGYEQGFRDALAASEAWWPTEPVQIPHRRCTPRATSPRVYPLTGGASNRAGGRR